VAAFRQAAMGLLGRSLPLSLAAMEAEHALLSDRLTLYGNCQDALDIWRLAGVPDPSLVADLEAAGMHALKSLTQKEQA
jgi:malonate decarboxylase beta subunit